MKITLLIGLVGLLMTGCQTMSQGEPVTFEWRVQDSPAKYQVVYQEIDVKPGLMVSGFEVLDNQELRNLVKQELRSLRLPPATYEGRVESHEGLVRATVTGVVPDYDGPPQDDQEKFLRQMIENNAGNAELVGDFSNNGELRSFYHAQKQRNALNLLFSLAGRSLETGDYWQPRVFGVEVGPGFFPEDTRRISRSFLESVTATDDGEQVATMLYVISDEVDGYFRVKREGELKEVPVSISHTYLALGDFNVTTGRWESFTGVSGHLSRGTTRNESMILYALRPEG
ncbi:hypothetical protein MLC59_05430 [Marinobacter bryozoorum]|uniref:hypothetical protein n=1 Tax=Marinobacter bryozoorum TaxID=256324 RepID=UPI0020048BF3|nr:hypothetical protein [Marinobacter bryozoorum]MCK7543605.1 hypothetical protein [Marinobacter bryozoorum]